MADNRGYNNRMMRCPFNDRRQSVCPQSNCKDLMHRLRMVDFSIIETAMYLDAYPKCQKALEYYHKLIEERMQLADMVNERCGPLTIKSNVSRTDWTWVKGPWPWEPDAN